MSIGIDMSVLTDNDAFSEFCETPGIQAKKQLFGKRALQIRCDYGQA